MYPYVKDCEVKYIACNVLSSSLALMDEKKYRQYLDFCNEGKPIQDSEFIEDLKRGGFLIEDNFDELEVIRHDMYNAKFNTSDMILTIAPTINCNFRCIYCYEKGISKEGKMTKEIANYIISYIKEKAKFLRSLNITWYGGEPLLEIDMIEYLSNEFIKICDENNIYYQASIVTNGYNLNERNIQILLKSKVHGIQITIDGSEALHNKRRPLFDGSSTFSTIINNLKLIKKYNHFISLRINVDKSNIKDAFCVADILKEMGLEKHVIPYLALVRNHNDCYKNDICLNIYDFINFNKEFKSYTESKGFINTYSKGKFPLRLNCYCSAERANSFVIGPDGELYKCWNDIGNSQKSVGNIGNGVSKNYTYLEYVMSDPTNDKKCRVCEYLPICFSGCPFNRKSKVEDICLQSRTELKNELYDIIDNYFDNL